MIELIEFRAIDVEVSRKRKRVICSSLLRRRLKWAEKKGKGGREGKSIEAPWKLEIDLCRYSLIASASNNLRLKTNGLNCATMSYTTSGPFIDTIPRYALIPLKLALLVSKIGQSEPSAFCYIAHRPNNNSNFQTARWRWSVSLIGLIHIENYFWYEFYNEEFNSIKNCKVKIKIGVNNMLLFIRSMLKFKKMGKIIAME